MANYVKFRKGSPQAYANLDPNYDNDTLYFIYDEDEDDAKLYLGNKLIAGGSTDTEDSSLELYLNDLLDVEINNIEDKNILVYDAAKGYWVNLDYRDVVEEFVGATESSNGVSGLVPAPEENNPNLFLRSDGKWVSIEYPEDNINLTAEEPISIDGNGVISLAINKQVLGIIDNSLSIKGFEDAEVNAILTKTENGLKWIVPEENRNEEFSTAIDLLNKDITALKSTLGAAAVKDEAGNIITAASGVFAEFENLNSDINNLENAVSRINTTINETKTEISDIKTSIDEIEDELFEKDKTLVQIQSDIQDLSAAATNLENNKADKTDVYTKSETQIAINEAIAGVDHLKRKIVAGYDSIVGEKEKPGADQYIYMVPNEKGTYDEYMIIIEEIKDDDGEIIQTLYEIEKVGDWETDLSNYVTTTVLNEEISNLDNKFDNALKSKADIVYYPVEGGEKVPGAFLSPEDKEKLAALVIDKDGNVGISGSVNADNVEGLGTWITENSNTYITNLTENNLGSSILDKLNFITSINTFDFSITDGKLELNNLELSKINGLKDALNTKVSLEQFNTLNTTVQNLVANIEDLDNIFITKTIFDSTVGDLNALISTNTTNIESLSDKVDILDKHLSWEDI